MAVSDILIRLLAATAFGIGLGLNRYLHHKSIGVRTLGLLAVTACGLVLAVLELNGGSGLPQLIQGIVTGIGFVGAGLILHQSSDETVHGLTTAATVWVAAAGGILCGLGAWPVLLAVATIIGVLLGFGGRLEKAIRRRFDVDDAKDKGGPPAPS